MPTQEQTIAILQEISDRGEQARLNPNQLKIFTELSTRGIITPLDTTEEGLDDFQFFERSLGQQILGTGEMLTTMLTGALTEPVAGVEGIIHGVAAFVAGDDDPLLRASETVQRRREAGTRLPRTEAGKESLMAVSRPIESLFRNVIEPVAQQIGDMPGPFSGPLGSTVAQTVMEVGIPGRKMGLKPDASLRRSQGTQRMNQIQANTGVILDDPQVLQAEAMGNRAQALTGGQTQKAQNFERVQQSLIKAREVSKANTDALYATARDTKAAIPREFITILNDSINEVLTDIDVKDFKGKVMTNRVNLNNRLEELDALVLSDKSPDVMLNELSAFRQRLNKNRGSDASENFALGEVKGVLDSFLNDMFDADLISGDPAAVKRWTDANRAFADYKSTFSDDRVMRKLTEQQANPEQVKNWIMGANAVGAKAEAGAVVDSIANVVGRDSPEFASIRQEVLFDVMKPLLSEEPNLNAFVNNYDKFIRNNKSLGDSVFPDSLASLKDLRDLAKASGGVITPRIQLNLTKSAAKAFFGHALAKGQLRINVAEQIMRSLASAGTSRSRQISARVLGYNPRQPVLPVRPLLGIGALQTLGEPADENRVTQQQPGRF